jgi:hypothetical protein
LLRQRIKDRKRGSYRLCIAPDYDKQLNLDTKVWERIDRGPWLTESQMLNKGLFGLGGRETLFVYNPVT